MVVYAISILRNHAPRHGTTAKRYISPQPTRRPTVPTAPTTQRRHGKSTKPATPTSYHWHPAKRGDLHQPTCFTNPKS